MLTHVRNSQVLISTGSILLLMLWLIILIRLRELFCKLASITRKSAAKVCPSATWRPICRWCGRIPWKQ